MPRDVRRVILATLALVAIGFAGCWKVENARNRVKASNDLKQIAVAYHQFQDTEGRPPKSYEELTKKYPLPAECAQATVYWGAGVGPKCKDGPTSDVILGHLPNPGSKGVLAMYCDGSVKAITDEEFNSAIKAKPLKD
jgi:hypothetical protein